MTIVKLTFRMPTDSSRKGTLYFQITHQQTVRNLCTNCHIFASEWDCSSNTMRTISPISSLRTKALHNIQHKISSDMQRLNGIICKYDNTGLPYNTTDIVNCFRHPHPVSHDSLFAFMHRHIAMLRSQGRMRTADTYSQTLNSIIKFRNGLDISFTMLDATLAESYESWLRSRRLCRNTTSFYMRILRSVYNKAVAEGIAPKGEPFTTVYTGVDKTAHRAVSLADIRRIKKLNLTGNKSLAFARDMFLFSFYMRGMSFVDIAYLRKKDLCNNYIVYTRKKTGQQLSVRWEQPMQQIIDAYSPAPTQYLLPIITREDGTERTQYLNAMLRVNRNLKKIGILAGITTPLTMYVARHSWATAAKDNNISVSIISRAMGHDSESTTQIYLASILTDKIDNANSDILNGL